MALLKSSNSTARSKRASGDNPLHGRFGDDAEVPSAPSQSLAQSGPAHVWDMRGAE